MVIIRWQKPLKLYDRIIAPFVDESHNKILDVFGGTFSLGKWSQLNGYDYTGIEFDEEVFDYGQKNLLASISEE